MEGVRGDTVEERGASGLVEGVLKCAICGTPPLLAAAVKGKSLAQQALFFAPQY